jgi:inosine-uridine nucleoside N-ribohydrolase
LSLVLINKEAEMRPGKLLLMAIGVTCIIGALVGCGVAQPTPEATPILTPPPPAPTSIPTVAFTATVEPNAPAGEGEVVLVYDDDGSRDGLAALLYLLSYPKISVEAIGVSYGEAHPELYAQHIGRVLDELGIQGIPLGAGQDGPLAGGAPFPDWLRQLSDKFWDYPLPNADKTYPVQDAPELMVSTINGASEPVTLFLSGPFTNLVQALRRDPGIKDKIAAVYVMGGAVNVPGNITNLIPDSGNKVAEWNILADPQAAAEAFESGLDIYLVPLDATNKVILRQEDIAPWHEGDEKADMAADLYDIMFDNYGFESAEIFDLMAAVLTVNPELCVFEPLHLDVVTTDGNTLGQTSVDPNGEPNVHVCLEPDADLIRQELSDRFSSSQ